MVDHGREQGAGKPRHGGDVKRQRQRPIVIGAGQQRADGHEAGTVEGNCHRRPRVGWGVLRRMVGCCGRRVSMDSRPSFAWCLAVWMALAMTRALSGAKRSAVAYPMPWPAAVIKAVLSFKRMSR